MPSGRSTPFARPALLALLAALSFGVVTPLVQRFGSGVGPFTTGALLYLGASIAAVRSGGGDARKLARSELGRIALVAVLGAALAPSALAWGLARTSATSASLLLNLEAVFTVLLGRLVLREHLGARAWLAVAFIVVGSLVLALPHDAVAHLGGTAASSASSPASSLGALAIGVATLAWAADNILSRPLSDLHPTDVVRTKGALGAALSSILAMAAGEGFPAAARAAGLLACGAVGFGASLRLYLRAQRDLGAARTGSLFALAPFVGAAVAVALGDRPPWLGLTASTALLAIGVWLHLGERHGHEHVHPATTHEHPHRHDDGHHAHVHDPMPPGEHTHPHAHAPLIHDHAHAEDLHHRHRH